MIDFDPNTQEAFLSQDLAMKFLVWAAYYNGIVPDADTSFSSYGCFSDADAQRLDRIKDALFKCFGNMEGDVNLLSETVSYSPQEGTATSEPDTMRTISGYRDGGVF